jgi:hypothetical protein
VLTFNSMAGHFATCFFSPCERGPERICRISSVTAQVSHTCHNLRTMLHGRADNMASGAVRALSCASSLLPEIVGHVCTAGIKVQNATISAPLAANKGALEFLLCRSITLRAQSTFFAHLTFFHRISGSMSREAEIFSMKTKKRNRKQDTRIKMKTPCGRRTPKSVPKSPRENLTCKRG